MDCGEARKKIVLKLAEEIPAHETGGLDEHIAGCPGCQEFFSRTKDVWQQFSEPEEDMLARFKRQYRTRFLIFICIAVLAAVLLLILLHTLEY